jgi:tRNA-splicing ligase RtcB (3'-phosphate/5'-hydroxy nucleic acid ligase)
MEINTYRHDNIEITTGCKSPIKRWTVGVEVDQHAIAQLINVANLPFIFKHITVLPDCHPGKGSVVGSVIPTIGAIVPSFVGVDISCGIHCVRTTLRREMLPHDLAPIRIAMQDAVPHGFTKSKDKGSWDELPTNVNIAWMELEPGYRKIIAQSPRASHKGPEHQLGTLGGGNHYLELVYDENDQMWLMLHSGSRGVGNTIASCFINSAKQEMKKYHIELPDAELAYIPEGTDLFGPYIDAVNWCQRYAITNRELMAEAALRAIKKSKLVPKFEYGDEIIDCNHNYVTRENHYGKNILVTRKGAISARKGQAGIISGSMGTPSYIVSGLGCEESFTSASHGAGRAMSRTAAKQKFTLKDHREATEGIECLKDSSIIDETPGAYKPIADVMEAQKDLVEIVHKLRPLVVIKGT